MRISDWSSDVCSSDLRIVVNPVSGALGAEIEGIDLSQGLDNQTQDEVHRALLAHHVIFFRDQTMTPQDLASLARNFGPLNIHPYVQPLPEAPEVFAIIKEPDDRHHFGNGRHRSEERSVGKECVSTLSFRV